MRSSNACAASVPPSNTPIVIDAEGAEAVVNRVRAQVLELCQRFPVYGV